VDLQMSTKVVTRQFSLSLSDDLPRFYSTIFFWPGVNEMFTAVLCKCRTLI